MCFDFGALKIRDRIQTIALKVISKALSTVGALFRVPHLFFGGPYAEKMSGCPAKV